MDFHYISNSLKPKEMRLAIDRLGQNSNKVARKVTGTLASALEREAVWQTSAWDPLMKQLRESVRMSVDSEVVKRSEEISWRGDTDFEVSKEMLRSVRLPANPCWIEWCPRDTDPDDHDRAGMLIYSEDGELRVGTAFLGHGNEPFWNAAYAYASPKGLGVDWMWGKTEQREPSIWEKAAMIGLDIATRLLIVLTARNAPLLYDPPADFERLNLQRTKSGKPPLLSCKPVRWNVYSSEREAGSVLSSGARSDVSPHFCRGHFKLLPSGLVWWSPHWRALRGVSPANGGRDHQVRAGVMQVSP